MSGPAREGLALLQGMLICSRCGRRIATRYKGNGGIYPMYDCSALRRDGLSKKSCLSIRCDLLEEVIVERVFEVLKPAQIEIAVEAYKQIEVRQQSISRQWQMRIERAEYEAQLAERRYEEIDPSNRLVASTLEKRWNDSLQRLEELKTQQANLMRSEALIITDEQRAKVRTLAEDLPQLWRAPSTRDKDRKRILRLLIKDITVEGIDDKKAVVLHIRWQGGACEDITVYKPPSVAERVRYPDEIVKRVRELAQQMQDTDIAQTLNREGIKPTKGELFNVSMIRWIRYKHKIPSPVFKRPEELNVGDVAERFVVSRGVVYYWIGRGVIQARRLNKGSPYWIELTPEKDKELRDWVQHSPKIRKESNKP